MSDSNDRKSTQSAKISRRDVIKLSAGAAAFTCLSLST